MHSDSAMPSYITSAEVAERLGLRPVTFLKIRARLEAEDGFPPPVPQCRRPLRWKLSEVLGWIANSGRAEPVVQMPGKPPVTNLVLMAEARRA
jgi:predicted DNA-binding transcriptional regulator AlpA